MNIRVCTFLLAASITVLVSSHAALAASAVDHTALSELSSPDLLGAMSVVESKLNNRRFLRSHDTVDDEKDLGDGLDEESDDEERGFINWVSANCAKIFANFAKLDDIEAKTKSSERLYDESVAVTKQNVAIFRQMEGLGFTPAKLDDALATFPNKYKLDKKQATELSKAYTNFWETYPRRQITTERF